MIDSKWIIFLDIDGVLNNIPMLFKQMPHVTSDMKKPKYSGQIDDMLCQHPIRLLNKLVDAINGHVVLSSAWRIIHPVDEMNEILKRNGATFTIQDRTISTAYERGVEISEWLRQNVTVDIAGEECYNYNKYIILDDESDMLLRQKDHFFQMDANAGLSQPDVNKIIEYVKKQEKL